MVTKSTKIAPRPMRTKAETEKEFTEIQEQVTAAHEALDPKVEEVRKVRETETRAAVDGLSVDAVVGEISNLGLTVSKSLAALSDQLAQEVNRLATVWEAVTLEQKELERLHKIDVAATALDQLVQDYSRQKEQLEAEITTQRTAWAEEQRQTERDAKEQEEILKKQRQRETEDYEYRKVLERKKAQDKYEEEVKLQERANKEKQETLEKSWRERESALKASEEELKTLRKEAAEFPARLQRESEKAAGEAARATEQKFEQRMLLLGKDSEGEKRLSDLRIKALEESLARQSAQMAALEKQLEEAKRQVQEIAVKAIEGASGARALSHINEIAMEQAKHRTPQG
jgi:colicin import membrane protein